MGLAGSHLADTLDGVLDGHLGQGAVRQVVEHPLRHGLADLLDDHFADGRAGDLRLLRTKYKPSRKLTAYYRITRHVRGGHGAENDHLAVSWIARTQPGTPTTTVLVSPEDPAMPQLERLAQPAHLAGLLEALTGRQVESADRMSIDTVRYRPGQRHVLLARLHGGAGVYVKTDRDVSGARAVPVAELLARALPRWSPGDGVAEPVGYDMENSAALWWHAPGHPLSYLLTNRAAGSTRAVERVGRMLRALHDGASLSGPHPALDGIGSNDVQVEATSTLRAGEHIAALLAPVGETYEALVSAVAECLDRIPAEPATFGHGDFKCDNLLVHRGQLRILDLDRSCWAEPALDMGKFLADVRWWCPLGRDAGLHARAFRAGYGPCDPQRWVRAELIAALFQLKLAARRCLVHDIQWETQVRTRVADAAAALRVARSA